MQTRTYFSLQSLFLLFCFSLTVTLFADVEDRKVGQFDVLHVKGPMDVFITQSSDYQVRVEAPADKMSRIVTTVEKGELIVHLKNKKDKNNWNWGDNVKEIKIYVSVKNLEGLYLSGSGNVQGSGITANNLKVSIAGSGDLEIGVDARNIEAKIAGSGDMELEGNTGDFSISIAGNGDIEAYDLRSRNCEVKIAGSGDCQVNVSESLNVKISGSGDVSYKGNPSHVNKSVSGSGNVVER